MVWNSQQSKGTFDKMYKDATECTDTNQLVSMVFDMIDVLIEDGLAYIEHMHPSHMGISPGNRGGKKMLGQTMQKKGFKIKGAGFTFKLCGPDKAVAFENDPDTNNCEKHTLWVTDSELFGDYRIGSVRAGSAGCSHLNQWLFAALSGAKSIYPDMCDKNSDRFSHHILADSNKQLALALSKGLKWTLIKFQAERLYPLLPQLVQRALNVEHHIGEGDRYAKIEKMGCAFAFFATF